MSIPMKIAPKQKDHRMLLGLLFFAFGAIVFVKARGLDVPYVTQIPDNILLWATAVGSAVGGLYMIYKSLTKRKLYVGQ
ncbi:TPA: hypothetical protein HA297_01215 [Candidatus Woesearchaeota archaeon]|nr:hypothetical protein [Candidatus Woesearchaeota archaeon]